LVAVALVWAQMLLAQYAHQLITLAAIVSVAARVDGPNWVSAPRPPDRKESRLCSRL